MALLRSENGFVVVLSRYYLFAQTVGEIFFYKLFCPHCEAGGMALQALQDLTIAYSIQV